MTQDLRLYSLSLLIVLMLWTSPVRADYGVGSGCPVLAVPIQLNDGDIWHYEDENDPENNNIDYRPLYPYNTTASISGQWDDGDCVVNANSGTYYDGGNHLWVLDDNLTCNFAYSGEGGDFRAGDY